MSYSTPTTARGSATAAPGGVIYSDWVDLTATITAAVAGGLDSDPDSEGASLTVTTTTGTFEGETVDCNEFAWTTHASTNDGHAEAMRVSLGTVLSHLPGLDPSVNGWQIVADVVDNGTTSAYPLVFVGVEANGGAVNYLQGAGWGINFDPSMSAYRYMTNSTGTKLTLSTSFGEDIPQMSNRYTGEVLGNGRYAAWRKDPESYAETVDSNGIPNLTSSAELHLVIGSQVSTSGPVVGVKMRFRIRTISHCDRDITDTVY